MNDLDIPAVGSDGFVEWAGEIVSEMASDVPCESVGVLAAGRCSKPCDCSRDIGPCVRCHQSSEHQAQGGQVESRVHSATITALPRLPLERIDWT